MNNNLSEEPTAAFLDLDFFLAGAMASAANARMLRAFSADGGIDESGAIAIGAQAGAITGGACDSSIASSEKATHKRTDSISGDVVGINAHVAFVDSNGFFSNYRVFGSEIQDSDLYLYIGLIRGLAVHVHTKP